MSSEKSFDEDDTQPNALLPAVFNTDKSWAEIQRIWNEGRAITGNELKWQTVALFHKGEQDYWCKLYTDVMQKRATEQKKYILHSTFWILYTISAFLCGEGFSDPSSPRFITGILVGILGLITQIKKEYFVK